MPSVCLFMPISNDLDTRRLYMSPGIRVNRKIPMLMINYKRVRQILYSKELVFYETLI